MIQLFDIMLFRRHVWLSIYTDYEDVWENEENYLNSSSFARLLKISLLPVENEGSEIYVLHIHNIDIYIS